jgi:DHA1 family tetracycline resistance protein-like MFS transporter
VPPGFGIIWTTVAVDLVGFGMVFPLLPLYARRFGASPATIGLLVASFSAAQFALAPVWGRLSDRIGRKPVLIMSLVGTALASLATGLAGSIWLLFVARIIDGGSGGSLGVAHAAVTDIAEPAERPRLFGLLGAAFGVGFVAGPALASLAALGGPRLPFLIAAGIAAANAVAAVVRLPETHPPSARHRANAARVAPSAAVETSQRRVLLALGIATVCSISAFSAFEAVFALYANHRASLGLSGTGGVFAVIGVLIVVVQTQLVHRVVAWLGEAIALVTGLVIQALGLALLPTAHSLAGLALPLVVLTVGQGLVSPTLSLLVAGRAPSWRRGGALSIQQGLSSLARVIGPAFGGWLFTLRGGTGAFLVGAGVTVVAVAASVLVAVDRGVSSGPDLGKGPSLAADPPKGYH